MTRHPDMDDFLEQLNHLVDVSEQLKNTAEGGRRPDEKELKEFFADIRKLRADVTKFFQVEMNDA